MHLFKKGLRLVGKKILFLEKALYVQAVDTTYELSTYSNTRTHSLKKKIVIIIGVWQKKSPHSKRIGLQVSCGKVDVTLFGSLFHHVAIQESYYMVQVPADQ